MGLSFEFHVVDGLDGEFGHLVDFGGFDGWKNMESHEADEGGFDFDVGVECSFTVAGDFLVEADLLLVFYDGARFVRTEVHSKFYNR